MVWEEKGKSEWEARVKNDEVVVDLDDWSTWHVSRDRVRTWMEVTQLWCSMWMERITLAGTQPKSRNREVVIQEDQDGDLGL